MPVGSMARQQKQKDSRQKLRESDQAQIQRSTRDFVDLPSHRDRLHFERGHDEEARDLVEREIGVGKEPGRVAKQFRFPHCLYCATKEKSVTATGRNACVIFLAKSVVWLHGEHRVIAVTDGRATEIYG